MIIVDDGSWVSPTSPGSIVICVDLMDSVVLHVQGRIGCVRHRSRIIKLMINFVFFLVLLKIWRNMLVHLLCLFLTLILYINIISEIGR